MSYVGANAPANLDGSAWYARQRWNNFINDDSSTCPGNSLVMLQSTTEIDDDGEPLYHVKQADNDCVCGALVAVTGPMATPKGGYGELTFDFPAIVKLNSGSATFNKLLGAKQNQWLIDTSKAGFLCVAALDDNRALVVPGPFSLRGKTTTATWNVDTDLDVQVWYGRDAGSVSSPTVTVNVRNSFANITATGDALIAWNGFQWMLSTFRCPGI